MVSNFSFMGMHVSTISKEIYAKLVIFSIFYKNLCNTRCYAIHTLFYNVGCFIKQDIRYKEEEGD